jgi:hypothetical protein
VIAGLIAKFGGPALKYGLIALALAAAVVAALFYIDGVREEGFKAGKAETEVQVITNTITIQKEITRAEKAAPRTRRAVADSLRSGGF